MKVLTILVIFVNIIFAIMQEENHVPDNSGDNVRFLEDCIEKELPCAGGGVCCNHYPGEFWTCMGGWCAGSY